MSRLKNEKVTKVKFGGSKGVTVEFKGQLPKGIPARGTFTIGADPFDTLKKAKDKLKAHFIKVVGLNPVAYMLDSDQLVRVMQPAKAKAFEKSTATRQAKQIEITGLTLGWDDDGKLIRTKLLAMYANEKDEVTSINAPLVDLRRADYYGIELDLERDILELLVEVEGFRSGNYTILEEPEEEEVVEEEKPKKGAKAVDPGDEQEEEDEDDDEPTMEAEPPSKMTVAKKAGPKKKAA